MTNKEWIAKLDEEWLRKGLCSYCSPCESYYSAENRRRNPAAVCPKCHGHGLDTQGRTSAEREQARSNDLLAQQIKIARQNTHDNSDRLSQQNELLTRQNELLMRQNELLMRGLEQHNQLLARNLEQHAPATAAKNKSNRDR